MLEAARQGGKTVGHQRLYVCSKKCSVWNMYKLSWTSEMTMTKSKLNYYWTFIYIIFRQLPLLKADYWGVSVSFIYKLCWNWGQNRSNSRALARNKVIILPNTHQCSLNGILNCNNHTTYFHISKLGNLKVFVLYRKPLPVHNLAIKNTSEITANL